MRDFDAQKNKDFKNALDGLFPARLIPVMLELSGIDPDKKVHEITKKERRQFLELIRKLPMTVEKTGSFCRGGDHPGRRKRARYQSVHDGIKDGRGAVFCRGGFGSGRPDRRV